MALHYTRRHIFISLALLPAILQAPLALAAEFDWNGTWAGTNPKNKRVTVITIQKGKVTGWTSNGAPQDIAVSEVKPDHVAIKHKEGATVWITPNKDGTVNYTWSGAAGQAKHKLKRS